MLKLTSEEFGEIVVDVMRKKKQDAYSYSWHPEDIAIAYAEVSDTIGYTIASLIEKGYLTNEK